LTEAGQALLPQLRVHWDATNAAADELSKEIGISLPAVLQKAIKALEQRSFLERIDENRQTQQPPATVPIPRQRTRVAAR
jgi:hypothetical protein